MVVKPGFHMIVPIVPVVSKQDQAIGTIIWKHNRDDPDDRDDHYRLDRFKFYPVDRGDREHLQAIKWKLPSHDADDRNDPKVSQNVPVIPRFNALSALRSKKMRSKMAQQTRESGDEALAPVYGSVSGKISAKTHNSLSYSYLKQNNSAIKRRTNQVSHNASLPTILSMCGL